MGWLGRASLMRRFRERPKGAKGASHAEISMRWVFKPRGESRWRGLEARHCQEYLRNIKGTSVAGTEWGQQRRGWVHKNGGGQSKWSPLQAVVRSWALVLSKMGSHWRTSSRKAAASYLILEVYTGCSVENKL